jgi:hypothetical protein
MLPNFCGFMFEILLNITRKVVCMIKNLLSRIFNHNPVRIDESASVIGSSSPA